MYMYVDVLKIHVIHFLGELFNSVVAFYFKFYKRDREKLAMALAVKTK